MEALHPKPEPQTIQRKKKNISLKNCLESFSTNTLAITTSAQGNFMKSTHAMHIHNISAEIKIVTNHVCMKVYKNKSVHTS